MKTFETIITVTEDDLDQLNHVNNVRYVQWVQDVASQHWDAGATQAIKDQYFWVLVKHTIEYKQPAFLGESIRLKTYIAKSEGVISTRIVEIYNNTTSKLLVTSKANWCLISKNTNRPCRITEEIEHLFT
ncbi:thioesterase family protein [Mangrovimonas sp. YM274]|uniref:acyl-CoA thioesterase n=1 Tax=Mangrovimonas sp. YM274 TaxID=3070660 RepID=UPI0027DD654A|nr:thioesterase family protein [Mangrovimonas sp. YM274]WMI67571.1 thioesterase family protein [Mangrovimonas sp. YM274]